MLRVLLALPMILLLSGCLSLMGRKEEELYKSGELKSVKLDLSKKEGLVKRKLWYRSKEYYKTGELKKETLFKGRSVLGIQKPVKHIETEYYQNGQIKRYYTFKKGEAFEQKFKENGDPEKVKEKKKKVATADK